MPVVGMHHVGTPARCGIAQRKPRCDMAEQGEAASIVGPVTAVLVLIGPARTLEQRRTIDQQIGSFVSGVRAAITRTGPAPATQMPARSIGDALSTAASIAFG